MLGTCRGTGPSPRGGTRAATFWREQSDNSKFALGLPEVDKGTFVRVGKEDKSSFITQFASLPNSF